MNSKYYLDILRKRNLPDSLLISNAKVFKTAAVNEADLFQYANHLQYYYTMTLFRLTSSRQLLRKASNLIQLLKKEYHLE